MASGGAGGIANLISSLRSGPLERMYSLERARTLFNYVVINGVTGVSPVARPGGAVCVTWPARVEPRRGGRRCRGDKAHGA
jgi:hypothetical protein